MADISRDRVVVDGDVELVNSIDGDILLSDSIDGEASLLNVVFGEVDLNTSIDGDISLLNTVDGDSTLVIGIPIGGDIYEGEYEVVPKTTSQTLETQNKLLLDDITVTEIPTYEVSNEWGKTFYIADIV